MPDINPYEPPSEESSEAPLKRTSRRTDVLLVVLAILMVPSAVIAGCVTCTTTALMTYSTGISEWWWIGTGIVTFIIVIGLFIRAIRRLNRRSEATAEQITAEINREP